MAITTLYGLTVNAPEAADTRYVSSGNPWDDTSLTANNTFEGLQVYNESNNTVYVLIDTTNLNVEAGWQAVGTGTGGGIQAYDSSESYDNGDVVYGSDNNIYVSTADDNSTDPASDSSANWTQLGLGTGDDVTWTGTHVFDAPSATGFTLERADGAQPGILTFSRNDGTQSNHNVGQISWRDDDNSDNTLGSIALLTNLNNSSDNEGIHINIGRGAGYDYYFTESGDLKMGSVTANALNNAKIGRIPTTDGAAGQHLISDGDGTVSWHTLVLGDFGISATASEIDILDGATLTTTELNYVDGVTSAIQTQLDGKQPLDSDLTTIAGFTHTDGNFIVSNGTTWVTESGATARTSLGLGSLATQNSVDLSSDVTGTLDISDHTNLAGGTGLTLSGDTMNLDTASTSQIGGVRLGYSSTDTTHYALLVDGDGRGYVDLPTGHNTTYDLTTTLNADDNDNIDLNLVPNSGDTDTITIAAGDHITLTRNSDGDITITGTGEGTDTTYSAGDGIDLTGTTFSTDKTNVYTGDDAWTGEHEFRANVKLAKTGTSILDFEREHQSTGNIGEILARSGVTIEYVDPDGGDFLLQANGNADAALTSFVYLFDNVVSGTNNDRDHVHDAADFAGNQAWSSAIIMQIAGDDNAQTLFGKDASNLTTDDSAFIYIYVDNSSYSYGEWEITSTGDGVDTLPVARLKNDTYIHSTGNVPSTNATQHSSTSQTEYANDGVNGSDDTDFDYARIYLGTKASDAVDRKGQLEIYLADKDNSASKSLTSQELALTLDDEGLNLSKGKYYTLSGDIESDSGNLIIGGTGRIVDLATSNALAFVKADAQGDLTSTVLPDASDSASGIVSTAAQTFAGAKQFSGGISIDGGTADASPAATEVSIAGGEINIGSSVNIDYSGDSFLFSDGGGTPIRVQGSTANFDHPKIGFFRVQSSGGGGTPAGDFVYYNHLTDQANGRRIGFFRLDGNNGGDSPFFRYFLNTEGTYDGSGSNYLDEVLRIQKNGIRVGVAAGNGLGSNVLDNEAIGRIPTSAEGTKIDNLPTFPTSSGTETFYSLRNDGSNNYSWSTNFGIGIEDLTDYSSSTLDWNHQTESDSVGPNIFLYHNHVNADGTESTASSAGAVLGHFSFFTNVYEGTEAQYETDLAAYDPANGEEDLANNTYADQESGVIESVLVNNVTGSGDDELQSEMNFKVLTAQGAGTNTSNALKLRGDESTLYSSLKISDYASLTLDINDDIEGQQDGGLYLKAAFGEAGVAHSVTIGAPFASANVTYTFTDPDGNETSFSLNQTGFSDTVIASSIKALMDANDIDNYTSDDFTAGDTEFTVTWDDPGSESEVTVTNSGATLTIETQGTDPSSTLEDMITINTSKKQLSELGSIGQEGIIDIRTHPDDQHIVVDDSGFYIHDVGKLGFYTDSNDNLTEPRTHSFMEAGRLNLENFLPTTNSDYTPATIEGRIFGTKNNGTATLDIVGYGSTADSTSQATMISSIWDNTAVDRGRIDFRINAGGSEKPDVLTTTHNRMIIRYNRIDLLEDVRMSGLSNLPANSEADLKELRIDHNGDLSVVDVPAGGGGSFDGGEVTTNITVSNTDPKYILDHTGQSVDDDVFGTLEFNAQDASNTDVHTWGSIKVDTPDAGENIGRMIFTVRTSDVDSRDWEAIRVFDDGSNRTVELGNQSGNNIEVKGALVAENGISVSGASGTFANGLGVTGGNITVSSGVTATLNGSANFRGDDIFFSKESTFASLDNIENNNLPLIRMFDSAILHGLTFEIGSQGNSVTDYYATSNNGFDFDATGTYVNQERYLSYITDSGGTDNDNSDDGWVFSNDRYFAVQNNDYAEIRQSKEVYGLDRDSSSTGDILHKTRTHQTAEAFDVAYNSDNDDSFNDDDRLFHAEDGNTWSTSLPSLKASIPLTGDSDFTGTTNGTSDTTARTYFKRLHGIGTIYHVLADDADTAATFGADGAKSDAEYWLYTGSNSNPLADINDNKRVLARVRYTATSA